MNRLLAALPDIERERIAAMLEPVELDARQELSAPDAAEEWVYFPHTALVAEVAELADGRAEVAMIGCDGLVGAELLLWGQGVPFRHHVHVPGRLARMRSDVFRREAAGGALCRLVLGYAQALAVQMGVVSACARVHDIDHRLARWLLMVHDRVPRPELPVTQELVGEMLGVRRASVSATLGIMERAGLVRHGRGLIEVRDRAGLEAAACACYRTIRDAHERVLAPSL